MTSFTERTFLLVALTAFGHLLCMWFLPVWIMALVSAGIVSAVIIDFLLTRPAFTVIRTLSPRMEHDKDSPVAVAIETGLSKPLKLEIEDCPPDTFFPEAHRHTGVAPVGERLIFDYSVRPMRRGSFDFGNIFIRYTGILGLVRRKAVLEVGNSVQVFPKLDDFRRFSLYANTSYFQMQGLKKTRLIAEGTMFESLRDYQRDDDYGRIDWKATARMQKPISRNYETERNQNVILMLDTGRLMGSTINKIPKLDYAIRTAMALGIVCVSRGDNVGLMCFDHHVNSYIAPAKGRRHFSNIMERMYRLSPGEFETNFEAAFQHLLARKLRRSLVVVLTDLVDVEASNMLVRYLCALHPRHERLCIVLKDSEVEELAAVSPAEQLDVYRKSVAMKMLEKRRMVTAQLSGRGVGIVEARPEKLSLLAVQKYLELKKRGSF